MSLLSEIDAFCERTGTTPTRFGIEAVNSAHFVHRLRNGLGSPQARTVARARAYMRDNPDGRPRGRWTRSRSAAEYIALRVKPEDRGHSSPCLIWQQWVNAKGYARAVVPGMRKMPVHRAAYELRFGPVPDGLEIDHLCRVPSCCNPEHLEAVTPEENRRRAAPFKPPGLFTKKDFCSRGHDLSINRKPNGKCRLCARIHKAEHRQRKRECRLEAVA